MSLSSRKALFLYKYLSKVYIFIEITLEILFIFNNNVLNSCLFIIINHLIQRFSTFKFLGGNYHIMFINKCLCASYSCVQEEITLEETKWIEEKLWRCPQKIMKLSFFESKCLPRLKFWIVIFSIFIKKMFIQIAMYITMYSSLKQNHYHCRKFPHPSAAIFICHQHCKSAYLFNSATSH